MPKPETVTNENINASDAVIWKEVTNHGVDCPCFKSKNRYVCDGCSSLNACPAAPPRLD